MKELTVTPSSKSGRVRLRLLALAALAVVAGVAATIAAAGPGGADNGTACVFNTALSPANEIRTLPTTDPVDSTAEGHAQIKVRNDGTIEYKVQIFNPAAENFFMGHIHAGAATANGGIVVDLLGGAAGGTASTDEHIVLSGDGVPRATAPANIAELLCSNPTGYYVNFHTTADPSGAIRGQLG
jgi:hypothetical protein